LLDYIIGNRPKTALLWPQISSNVRLKKPSGCKNHVMNSQCHYLYPKDITTKLIDFEDERVDLVTIRGSHAFLIPFSIFKKWGRGTLPLILHDLWRSYSLKIENNHSSPSKVKNGHKEDFASKVFCVCVSPSVCRFHPIKLPRWMQKSPHSDPHHSLILLDSLIVSLYQWSCLFTTLIPL